MKTFIINLGIGNSRFDEISDAFTRRTAVHNEVSMLARLNEVKHMYEWAEGEYEGKPEETMVITLTAPSVGAAYDFATVLARVFTQQCVAIYDLDGERGDLVWSDVLADKPYEFDPAFFIMPKYDTTVSERIRRRLAK